MTSLQACSILLVNTWAINQKGWDRSEVDHPCWLARAWILLSSSYGGWAVGSQPPVILWLSHAERESFSLNLIVLLKCCQKPPLHPWCARGNYSFYLHFPENSSVAAVPRWGSRHYSQFEGGKLSVSFKQGTAPLSSRKKIILYALPWKRPSKVT